MSRCLYYLVFLWAFFPKLMLGEYFLVEEKASWGDRINFTSDGFPQSFFKSFQLPKLEAPEGTSFKLMVETDNFFVIEPEFRIGLQLVKASGEEESMGWMLMNLQGKEVLVSVLDAGYAADDGIDGGEHFLISFAQSFMIYSKRKALVVCEDSRDLGSNADEFYKSLDFNPREVKGSGSIICFRQENPKFLKEAGAQVSKGQAGGGGGGVAVAAAVAAAAAAAVSDGKVVIEHPGTGPKGRGTIYYRALSPLPDEKFFYRYPNFVSVAPENVSINLMWLVKKKDPTLEYLGNMISRENKHFMEVIPPQLIKWMLLNPESTVVLWFDSEMSTEGQIRRTNESILEQIGKIKTQNPDLDLDPAKFVMRDVRSLEIMSSELKRAFSDKVPIYTRVNALRVIAAVEVNERNLKEGISSAFVYSDYTVNPHSFAEVYP